MLEKSFTRKKKKQKRNTLGTEKLQRFAGKKEQNTERQGNKPQETAGEQNCGKGVSNDTTH